MSDPERKPVLWVSLTDHGRGVPDAESLQNVAETIEETVGDDYHVVAADDKVRLATREDLQEMRDALDRLLPSEVESEAEQQERQADEMGLSAEDVMEGDTDAPGVQEEAGDE